MKNITITHAQIIVLSAILGLLVVLAIPQAVSAQFYKNGSNIIDNAVFRNDKAMSRAQVQEFLEERKSGLKDRSFQFNCYSEDSQEREIFTALKAPCDEESSAADIIYFVSRAYGINPQVTLAQLQKEQSLITSQEPSQWQINQAMGYNCPTSGHCNDESGFFYQLDHGVWVLRYHYERARGNTGWWNNNTNWTCGTEKNLYKPNLYPNQDVKFYDTNGVHYRTYKLANAATSSMYCYSPHTYNNPEGLYGRDAYGTTGLYYSGSFNFVNSFYAWFGSPMKSPNNIIPVVYDNSVDTTGELATIGFKLTAKPKSSVSFKIEYDSYYVTSGESTVTIAPNDWNKPRRNLVTLKGRYRQGLSGSSTFYLETGSLVSNDSDFRLSSKYTADIPILHQDLSNGVYRLFNPDSNSHTFTGSESERETLVSQGWRDEGIAFYGCNAGDRTLARVQKNMNHKLLPYNSPDYFAHIRNGFTLQTLVTTTSGHGNRTLYVKYRPSSKSMFYTHSATEGDSAGFVTIATMNVCRSNIEPIFRLYNSTANNHFYTASRNERNIARERHGYRYEGVAFYVTAGGTTPVYRLFSSQQKNHFYTTSTSERDSAVRHGFRNEGVVFKLSEQDSTSTYRLYSGSAGNHFYTNSPGEAKRIEANGYRLEGVGLRTY